VRLYNILPSKIYSVNSLLAICTRYHQEQDLGDFWIFSGNVE